ncbi:hypothetical protein [Picrophilus oshimae]|uniref:Uncharacterized protein n=1 Tax=Picrophilus torridus (strain ATCC 700027 / DSM 9790 / JCM 10055 / NBRC 100828 / KAW 2/3) TaxID=1122961 RepID=A0A8G2FWN0_PICTO|nr:hypothetical protein [Picrophilus oshimae]SMD30798.1 hypothetical protein SAMN02745355_0709 [Picrophilus oshimae DSM 9789]
MAKNYNYCPLSYENNLFFSLVDYRNNYFTSNNINNIIKFYDSFQDREQLIKWMKERPKGNCAIREIEGRKDVIVIIPTIDADSKLANNCKDNIFKGLHIIFVESGYNNFYFNYAHNCNVGVKKALEYNPKWIILSNDDMYKIDSINILLEDLEKMDPDNVITVYINKSNYHSTKRRIVEKRIMYNYIILLKRLLVNGSKLYKFTSKKIELEKKLKCIYMVIPNKQVFNFLTKGKITLTVGMSFQIFGISFFKKYGDSIFDETFINDAEDIDLSFRLFMDRARVEKSKFRIGDMIGSSLGSYKNERFNLLGLGINDKNMLPGVIRELRSISNSAYFNLKILDKYYATTHFNI